MAVSSRNGDVLRYCAGTGFRSRVTCRRVPRFPTYESSISVFAVISRWTPNCHRCIYEDVVWGSKKVIPWPKLVARPPVEPGAGTKPPGKGLVRLATYDRPLSSDGFMS